MKRLITVIFVEQRDCQCFNELLKEVKLIDFKDTVKTIKLERAFSNSTDHLEFKGNKVKPWFEYECGSTGATLSVMTCEKLLKLIRLGYINLSEVSLEKDRICFYLEKHAVEKFISDHYENEDTYDHRRSIEENILKVYSV